jgi:hypothetical protein
MRKAGVIRAIEAAPRHAPFDGAQDVIFILN